MAGLCLQPRLEEERVGVVKLKRPGLLRTSWCRRYTCALLEESASPDVALSRAAPAGHGSTMSWKRNSCLSKADSRTADSSVVS